MSDFFTVKIVVPLRAETLAHLQKLVDERPDLYDSASHAARIAIIQFLKRGAL